MVTLPPTSRRAFVSSLGAAAGTALLTSPSYGFAPAHSNGVSAAWDMSWLDKLARRPHKVAFDATVIDDGIALDHAAMILDQFHEVYGIDDAQVGVVIVMRQLGTRMGFADELWERYTLGADAKIDDPKTKQPARRNPFYSGAEDMMIERLIKRGVIVLVCNNATTNIARQIARRDGKDVDTVVADFRSHLVPGAVMMPSGVFAMICAQNAGCAFMRAS